MTAHGTPSPAHVERVEVFSNWLGFAHPPNHSAKLVMTRASGTFTRTVEPAGPSDELPAAAVAALVDALGRPPVPQLDPALFPHLPEPVLRRHYQSRWTDDHPEMLVRVAFAGGKGVSVHTKAQQAFMLPLTVRDESTGDHFETYDPTLSRAIAALLPKEFLNGERLGGDEGLLRYELDQHAKRRQQSGAADETEDDEWRRLREYRHPDPLSEPLLGDQISADEVRRLLAAGADPNVTDDVHQTALMLSSYRRDAERFRLLVAAGANVEARRDGFTGLHLAAAGGEGETTALWLEAGADVHARTPEGATALMLGALWPDVLEVLLRAGADVNAVDEDGHGALVYAIKEQRGVWPHAQLAAMKMLIDAGTDLGLRDKEGVTPLGHARQKLAQERMAREVRKTIGAADPTPEYVDPSQLVDPDTHESPLGWSDLRMAGEVVKLLEAAGARD